MKLQSTINTILAACNKEYIFALDIDLDICEDKIFIRFLEVDAITIDSIVKINKELQSTFDCIHLDVNIIKINL